MKKITIAFIVVVLFALLLILLNSCEKDFPDWKPIYITNYKGCEYYLDGYRLCHSGVCPNPIHPENWTKEMWKEKLEGIYK